MSELGCSGQLRLEFCSFSWLTLIDLQARSSSLIYELQADHASEISDKLSLAYLENKGLSATQQDDLKLADTAYPLNEL